MTGMERYLKFIFQTLLLAGMFLFHAGAQAQDLPDIPRLIRVTVDHSDDGVLIEWEASTSPNIRSYLIYEKHGDVFILLDSVPASN